MRRSLIYTLASVGLAASLAACQQQQEEGAPAAAGSDAADVTIAPPAVNPPDVTITPPADRDVVINPPNVTVNPPDVDRPREKSTTESTTVTVPGVGSTTTTTERR